jgi:hypothetical protein
LPDKECFLQTMSLAKSRKFQDTNVGLKIDQRAGLIQRLNSVAIGLTTPIMATYW